MTAKLAGSTAVLLTLSSLAALAQTDLPNQRARPEYDPQGVRAGAFIIMPKADVSARYDDNVFATTAGRISDWIFVGTPSVEMKSNWNNHALDFKADAEIGRYADQTRENYEDYSLALDGRLDIVRGSDVTADVSYLRRHEARGTPNDVGGRNPTQYDLMAAGLEYRRAVGRISVKAGGDIRRYNFDNVQGLDATIINNNVRDRDEYSVNAQAGYELVQDTVAFLRGTYNWRQYDDDKTRNSKGYAVTVGTNFRLSGVTQGEVFVGYRNQRYDPGAFGNTKGLTYGGSLFWTPTALTTVTVTLLNEVEETIVSTSSGFVASSISARVDHELLRNVLLNAVAGYTRDAYKRSPRKDSYWELGAGARYLLNRNLGIGVNYRYSKRSGNLPGLDYRKNAITLSVTGQI